MHDVGVVMLGNSIRRYIRNIANGHLGFATSEAFEGDIITDVFHIIMLSVDLKFRFPFVYIPNETDKA